MLTLIVLAGWTAVGMLAFSGLRMLRQESRSDRVLGLLYHRVVPPEVYARFTGTEQIFSIPLDRFREQLAWLRDAGHHFVSLDQLTGHLKHGEKLPPKPVSITFDDGCESVYAHALPVLRELSIPATVFVTTDENAWIFHEGEYYERRMTLDELRACAAAGVSIGSHAVTHRGLNEMSRDDVMRELVESRRVLADWVGEPVRHFAVPLNFYNRETLALARQAGYDSVCTSDNGTSNRGTDPYRIKRFIVEGSSDLAAFRRSLEPAVIVQRRLLNALKKLPPRLLGERIWMPLRERIFASPLGRWLTFGHLRRALLTACGVALALLVAVTIAALVP